jgi:hypothetical protein
VLGRKGLQFPPVRAAEKNIDTTDFLFLVWVVFLMDKSNLDMDNSILKSDLPHLYGVYYFRVM